ncbi:MAG: four helix bundle protein [Phycisphaerales bacterium]
MEERQVKPRVSTFRDLIAWQKAMDLVREVYQQTRSMPDDERFGLTTQLRRAAVSVPSNIAEGYARGTTADYLRCLRIARGSLAEVQTQVEIAQQLQMLNVSDTLTDRLAVADRVLQALIRSLETKLRTDPR